ncbi:response regulator transcription factor [Domibacillus aminovorans]|uniref:Two-component system response regulator n=1 Tax=Domibacillus aminovorans TaxID=29332 RepID=A0A177L567_9BACI|nr:response regulator transcription factor [Domibacillus aminovorans]OAH60457.1 two-component system response regulator [Domibacillus aminovorans]
MRVLLVEDEIKVARFISQGLKEHHYVVDVAHDGEMACELAYAEDYDLLIVDLMIPKKNGARLIKELRLNGKNVPILILSAKDSVIDKVEGLDIGADDYMTKPFAFTELLARLRSLLRRKQEKTSPLLQIADLKLNPSTREVTRGVLPIFLSNKEYAILEFMMRNACKILPRTLILEHVWMDAYNIGTNVVDVHINHLRNKIDKNFDLKLIQTIYSVGYMIKGGNE